MEDWEKEKQDLKKKPHLKLQKDVWVDFLVNPKVVVVAVNIIVQGLHLFWAPSCGYYNPFAGVNG